MVAERYLEADTRITAHDYPHPDRLPVGVRREINHYATCKGEMFLYNLVLYGIDLGIIQDPQCVSDEQIVTTAHEVYPNFNQRSLKNYFKNISDDAQRHLIFSSFEGKRQKLITKPRAKASDQFLSVRPLSEIKRELLRRSAVDLCVKYFRDHEVKQSDMVTGETYTLPAVDADISATALMDTIPGLDELTAQRMAEALRPQPFDAKMHDLRCKAFERVREAQAAFADSLDDPLTVPPSKDIPITDESDLKRAMLRAWCIAKIPQFESHKEQCYALGISVNTLRVWIPQAGIVEKQRTKEIEVDPNEDVGGQIRKNMRDLKAFPRSVGVQVTKTDPATGEMVPWNDDFRPFKREALDDMLKRGVKVVVKYHQSNEQIVGDVPERVKKVKKPRAAASTKEKKVSTTRRAPATPKTPPGFYPPTWVQNHLCRRYQRAFGHSAPPKLTIREIAECLISGRKQPAITLPSHQPSRYRPDMNVRSCQVYNWRNVDLKLRREVM